MSPFRSPKITCKPGPERSRSITPTRWSRARVEARLAVRVVLPVPPLKECIAITLVFMEFPNYLYLAIAQVFSRAERFEDEVKTGLKSRVTFRRSPRYHGVQSRLVGRVGMTEGKRE